MEFRSDFLKDAAARRRPTVNSFNEIDDVLREGTKRDIKIARFVVENAINEVEDNIGKIEEQRDYKMKSKEILFKCIVEFEREKDQFLNQQSEFKNKIEAMSMSNLNERLINLIKEEKNNQQDLYNKYYTLNTVVQGKIKNIKESLPAFEEKLKSRKQKLKDINFENLRLIEKIKELESGKKEKTEIIKLVDNSRDTRMEDTNIIMDNSQNITTRPHNFLSSNFQQSINITELIDENELLKEKFQAIKNLKDKLKNSKREKRFLSNEIATFNTKSFYFTKIFTEGLHEISKELLKIHEIQLDKIVQRNANGNSLYFELIRDRLAGNMNGIYNNKDDSLKLPLISNNTQKKYNYPVGYKSDPNTSIYNVIKNLLEEHHILNRNLNTKKKKIEWEEFKTLSSYQIFTLLSLNRNIIKHLENKIYPRKLEGIDCSTSIEKD